jgi:hypothetical protein
MISDLLKQDPKFKRDVNDLLQLKQDLAKNHYTNFNYIKKVAKEYGLRATTLAYIWSEDFDFEKEFDTKLTVTKIFEKEYDNNNNNIYTKNSTKSNINQKNTNVCVSTKKKDNKKTYKDANIVLVGKQKTSNEEIKTDHFFGEKDHLEELLDTTREQFVSKSSREEINESYKLSLELKELTNNTYNERVLFCARRAYFGVPHMVIEEEMREVSQVTFSSSVIKSKLKNLAKELKVKEFSEIYCAIENKYNL